MDTKNKGTKRKRHPFWGWVLAIFGGLFSLFGLLILIVEIHDIQPDWYMGVLVISVPSFLLGIPLLVIGVQMIKNKKENEDINTENIARKNKQYFVPLWGCISTFEHNKPVADFYCQKCSEEFELKSKQGIVGKKIVNGAYYTMIEKLESNNNPNFFFLTYDKTTLEIKNFLVTPKYLFTPDFSERKPLTITAGSRLGWL